MRRQALSWLWGWISAAMIIIEMIHLVVYLLLQLWLSFC